MELTGKAGRFYAKSIGPQSMVDCSSSRDVIHDVKAPMSSSSQPSVDIVRDFVRSALRRCGLEASTIPESTYKTPGLSLQIDGGRILIEV